MGGDEVRRELAGVKARQTLPKRAKRVSFEKENKHFLSLSGRGAENRKEP